VFGFCKPGKRRVAEEGEDDEVAVKTLQVQPGRYAVRMISSI
jgi:hypothetical protein